ncbi:MAG: hypothetical protein KKF62_16190 [Bacteroidetes bacterium]|nr:hypothetical protein [Bacteroidota bacterium]MBU1115348.1 hypothetical protein [Bacteroidota bacterium]MBU1800520.1 hypothetical protein [Bacteroidota bacterium]
MKKIIAIIVAISIQSTLVFCQTEQTNFTVLKGPYLGQKPPGNIPELFAPGIISREGYFEHSAAIFSPDGNEVYWSGKPQGARYFEINFMKMVNGRWTEPKIAFSHNGYNFGNPVFSSDGNKLFFDSRGDIWFVERKSDGWTEPVQVSSLINSEGSETLRSITKDGSIYFSRYNANASSEGRMHEVYVSRKINGNYTDPEKLGKSINSDDVKEFGVFVAPDESYIIIQEAKGNISSELIIIYKITDGSWSNRIKLNVGWAQFPSVSPDGKYLFFMTRDGIAWRDSSFIEELKSTELK